MGKISDICEYISLSGTLLGHQENLIALRIVTQYYDGKHIFSLHSIHQSTKHGYLINLSRLRFAETWAREAAGHRLCL